MDKLFKILSILLLVVVLVLIRVFENTLFYDPFIYYFKNYSSGIILPEFETSKLLIHVFYRYVLNAIISFLILYVAFKNSSILKFSLLFYSISFTVLIISFTFLVSNITADSTMLFFYVRRFLIQPLFILLLLPAFYYQQLMKR